MERLGTEGPSLLPESTGCFRDQLWLPAAGGQLCSAPPGYLDISIYLLFSGTKKILHLNIQKTLTSQISLYLRRELESSFYFMRGGGGVGTGGMTAEGSCFFRVLEKLKQFPFLNYWSLEEALSQTSPCPMCPREPRAFLVGALVNPPPRTPQG